LSTAWTSPGNRESEMNFGEERPDSDETKSFLEDEHHRAREPPSHPRAIVPWVIALVFAALSAFLLIKDSSHNHAKESFQSGWSSDLGERSHNPVRILVIRSNCVIVSMRSQIRLERNAFQSMPSKLNFASRYNQGTRSLRYEGFGSDVDFSWDYLLEGK
jgi:hypothetical protein